MVHSHCGQTGPNIVADMYLAVWTVEHLEQRPSALPTHLQVVCGVDDLDAEVQRLKKKLSCEAGADDLISQDARRRPKGPQVAGGRPHALAVARRQVAQAGADEVVVDDGEEGLEESLHGVLHAKLRAHQKEADVGKELLHWADSLAGQATVRLLQGDVGVILRLPRQDLERVCRRKLKVSYGISNVKKTNRCLFSHKICCRCLDNVQTKGGGKLLVLYCAVPSIFGWFLETMSVWHQCGSHFQKI